MARQKLGQHFLVSGKALERIAVAACGERTELAVEIGPGRGALTEHLLLHADRVAAIELDPGLSAHLRERWAGESRFEIREGNALDARWPDYGPGVLVGNLPYYVTSKLITRFLKSPGQLRHGVFLIQKEVAERITAQPGSRDYGYLSVECQLLAQAEMLFAVPPGAFRPPPEVDSAVVRLIPRPLPLVADSEAFLRFASAAFRHKRKTLRNNLTDSGKLISSCTM
jgi:16S rRNA (adenine1518-N6/adenine1519-N6)-dimethyltransferase